MTVRMVATVGHPVLREWAQPVAPERLEGPEMQALIDDLIETMRYYNGAGLASPQVMDPQRIVVIEVHANPRYPYKPDIPLTVLVNPEIEALTDETFANNEGCLSVPNLRGVTHRLVEIGVRALDRHGRPVEREVQGAVGGHLPARSRPPQRHACSSTGCWTRPPLPPGSSSSGFSATSSRPGPPGSSPASGR